MYNIANYETCTYVMSVVLVLASQVKRKKKLARVIKVWPLGGSYLYEATQLYQPT